MTIITIAVEMNFMRIDKFAAEQANITRSEAKKLIKSGGIIVNGSKVTSADMKIDPASDIIAINGREILYKEYIYIMLNKPAGVICATRDRLSDTVIGLLPPEFSRRGLFPAGRLDKDTEGFVLITDDGELAHRMLSPKNHVEKEYAVTLERPAEERYRELFREGITIDGGEKCMPAEIIFTENEKVVRLILHEGKFHQVKRMMEAVGNKVTHLRRIRIGGITLDENLPLGGCREILHKEIQEIYAKHK